MNHSHIGRARLNGSPQDRAAAVPTTSAPQAIPGLTPERHRWDAAVPQVFKPAWPSANRDAPRRVTSLPTRKSAKRQTGMSAVRYDGCFLTSGWKPLPLCCFVPNVALGDRRGTPWMSGSTRTAVRVRRPRSRVGYDSDPLWFSGKRRPVKLPKWNNEPDSTECGSSRMGKDNVQLR